MSHAGVSVKNLYPHQQVRHSDGSTTNFPVSSQLVLHQSEIDTVFTANTATEGAFSSGSFVDCRIPAGSTGIITHMTLELRVKAGSGGCNEHPVPFLLAIERVETLLEAGNIMLSSHTAAQLMLPFRHLPQTALEMLQGPMGFHSDISPTAAYPQAVYSMAPNEENVYFCPLLENPLAANHVFGGALRSDTYLRVWFRGPSAFTSIDGPVPTLKTMNLIVTQQSLSPRDRAALAYRYASESLDFRFGRPGVQCIRATMGPSQRYQWALTAILGLTTELCITVTRSNGSAVAKVASYELLDGAGSSVIGGGAVSATYALMVKGARKQQSRALSANSLPWTKEERSIILEFGDSRSNAEAGIITGYVPMDGSFQLGLSTGADFVQGDYEVSIHYLAAARLNINRGTCSVFPS